jgi:muramoyltetrapeptide carboxypeptidase
MPRPSTLAPGDLVGIAAPASPFDREAFERGLGILRSWGLTPLFGDDLFTRHGYLAGIDRRRQAEIRGLFRDQRIKGIFCARGGYGAMRLLERLDARALSDPCRLFVGFSDITALHAFLVDHLGVPVVHGPVVTHLATVGSESLDALHRLLFLPEPLGRVALKSPVTITGGRASGILKGGNLSVLTRLLGTPFMPDLEGAVLFFEEVGERPYRIDRMLTHLRLSGALRKVAAVLVGQLVDCVEPDQSPGEPPAEEVLHDRLADLKVPVLAGFPAGHGTENHPLPLGLRATIDATEGVVTFEEGFAPR